MKLYTGNEQGEEEEETFSSATLLLASLLETLRWRGGQRVQDAKIVSGWGYET